MNKDNMFYWGFKKKVPPSLLERAAKDLEDTKRTLYSIRREKEELLARETAATTRERNLVNEIAVLSKEKGDENQT